MISRVFSSALVLAYASSVAADISGNPTIHPELNELVPVGKPYTIKWTNTTSGTVSLILLRGPSINVIPLATIAEKIPNTGSYVWTPALTLENDSSRYGINLTVDGTDLYQYTPQFGILNEAAPFNQTTTSTSGSVSVTTTLVTTTPASPSSLSVPASSAAVSTPGSASNPATAPTVIRPAASNASATHTPQQSNDALPRQWATGAVVIALLATAFAVLV